MKYQQLFSRSKDGLMMIRQFISMILSWISMLEKVLKMNKVESISKKLELMLKTKVKNSNMTFSKIIMKLSQSKNYNLKKKKHKIKLNLKNLNKNHNRNSLSIKPKKLNRSKIVITFSSSNQFQAILLSSQMTNNQSTFKTSFNLAFKLSCYAVKLKSKPRFLKMEMKY